MSEYKEGPKLKQSFEEIKQRFRAPENVPKEPPKALQKSTLGKAGIKIQGDIESPIEPPEAWESLQ